MGLALALLLLPAASDDGRRSRPIRADGLPRLHQVEEWLYRGGQPEDGGIERLREMGIRTILNLRSPGDDVEAERRAAEAAGLRFFHVPLPGWSRPGDGAVRRALRIVQDPENAPVFVHCQRGADRTGVVIACYRIGSQGWSASAALDEAKEVGMGWWQRPMRNYVRESCEGALADPFEAP